MPTLRRLRTLAFHAQQGRCYYCSRSMWLHSPDELGLRKRSSLPRQCTAEHLIARQDGGKDAIENVVAACWLCNQRRHRRKRQRGANDYRAFVQRRIASGRW